MNIKRCTVCKTLISTITGRCRCSVIPRADAPAAEKAGHCVKHDEYHLGVCEGCSREAVGRPAQHTVDNVGMSAALSVGWESGVTAFTDIAATPDFTGGGGEFGGGGADGSW